MARPRKFETDDILEKAMLTFWQKGYETTSTDDLEDATGLKRGSLYNAFTSKHGLYMAVLNHYSAVKMTEVVTLVSAQETAYEAAKSLLNFVVEDSRKQDAIRGCLLCDAAVERAPRDPDVADCVRSSFELLRNALAATAHKNTNGPATEKQKAEAGRLVAIYMGLRLHAKIGYSPEEIAAMAEQEISLLGTR